MENRTLVVNEIFSSIAGEYNEYGQGRLTTFVRLAGCNLACSYCDTAHTQDPMSGISMTINEIFDKIKDFGNKTVCITGGEPLIQSETPHLIYKLYENKFNTVLETNGTIDISSVKGFCNIIMDYKIRYMKMMHRSNFDNLLNSDAIKFVVGYERDFKEAVYLIKEVIFKSMNFPTMVFSPLSGMITAKELLALMENEPICKQVNAVLSVQLHKIIDVR